MDMNHIMKDHLGFHGGLIGELTIGEDPYQVEYTDPYGRPSYYTRFRKILDRKKNTFLIGGYQWVFGKMFNIGVDTNTTLRVGDLNDEAPQMKIGVSRANYKHPYYDSEATSGGTYGIRSGVNIPALDYICGFMVGDGATGEDNVTVIVPDYKRRSLYHPIPFRMSNDGWSLEKTKYFGKTKTYSSSSGKDEVNSYYLKGFENPQPHIVHYWASDNDEDLKTVDDTVFTSTSTTPIESFVEMNLSIAESDCRGYFTQMNALPRISEFGLVHGWYDSAQMDASGLQLVTHYTRTPILLEKGDVINMRYRIYAR